MKRYHVKLRRAYQVIFENLESTINKKIILQMIVKAINNTIDFDQLMLILLIFKTYSCMHVMNLSTSSIIIIIDHTRFDVDFSRLMREHLCKVFMREKLLKGRKTPFYAPSERPHWACYSTYNVLFLLYLWLLFLLS